MVPRRTLLDPFLAQTRRDFLKACGAVAMTISGVGPFLVAAKKSDAAGLSWRTIPPQTWLVGVPVYLNLADYCNNPNNIALTYFVDSPLPPGVALHGSVITGTPTVDFQASDFVAIATDQPPITGIPVDGAVPAAHPQLVAAPNPTGGAVVISGTRRSSLAAAGVFRVFSIAGRMVYERAIHAAGARYKVEWDGRGTGGSRLPSGVYVLVATIGPETARTKLVLTQ
jgi:hypothetical protein